MPRGMLTVFATLLLWAATPTASADTMDISISSPTIQGQDLGPYKAAVCSLVSAVGFGSPSFCSDHMIQEPSLRGLEALPRQLLQEEAESKVEGSGDAPGGSTLEELVEGIPPKPEEAPEQDLDKADGEAGKEAPLPPAEFGQPAPKAADAEKYEACKCICSPADSKPTEGKPATVDFVDADAQAAPSCVCEGKLAEGGASDVRKKVIGEVAEDIEEGTVREEAVDKVVGDVKDKAVENEAEEIKITELPLDKTTSAESGGGEGSARRLLNKDASEVRNKVVGEVAKDIEEGTVREEAVDKVVGDVKGKAVENEAEDIKKTELPRDKTTPAESENGKEGSARRLLEKAEPEARGGHSAFLYGGGHQHWQWQTAPQDDAGFAYDGHDEPTDGQLLGEADNSIALVVKRLVDEKVAETLAWMLSMILNELAKESA